MRLPSPSFQSDTPLSWRLDSHLGGGSPEFGLTPLLLLPTSIGTVYLGETFRACVSVWQQCAPGVVLHGVGIKLELQSSSRRWTLVDTTSSANLSSSIMSSGATKDLLVAHNLAELGVNRLVCLVTYRDTPDGPPRTFSKFFKFHVAEALHLHTTIHARDGALLAEVALTSLVPRALHLERVQFEPADPRILVEDLNLDDAPIDADEEADSNTNTKPNDAVAPVAAADGGRSVLLAGHSSRVFLFRFVVSPAYTDLLLGRLQLRWRSLLGESGRIKSSGISRTAPRAGSGSGAASAAAATAGIECVLVAAPASVLVEHPFTVRACVRNLTSVASLLVVQLVKDRMGTLLAAGPATRQLGYLAPGGEREFAIDLVGVGLGVHRVSGVCVSLTPCAAGTTDTPAPDTDTITQIFDHLHQVEVTRDSEEQ